MTLWRCGVGVTRWTGNPESVGSSPRGGARLFTANFLYNFPGLAVCISMCIYGSGGAYGLNNNNIENSG